MFESLRIRLTVIFLTIAVLPVLVVSGLLALRGYSTLQDEAITSQEEAAQLAASEISSFINDRDNLLRFVIETRLIGNQELEDQHALLSEMLTYDTTFQELRLLDSNGSELIRESRVQVFTEDDLTTRGDQAEFLRTVDSGDVYVSQVRIDEATREPLMTIARPIVDLRSGTTAFVLAADLRFRPIWDFIASTQSGEDTIFVIDARTGNLVAHANASIVLAGTRFNLPDGNGQSSGLTGEDVILAQESLAFGDQELVVVAERPTADALALATDGLRIAVTIMVATLIIAIMLVIFLVRQIVRPIEALSTVAQSITNNDFSARATVQSRDEIGLLAQSFNEMANRTQSLILNLEERVAEQTRSLKIAGDVSRDITRVLDPKVLLPKLVEQTRKGFDLYHVQLFTYESEHQMLRLAAATGEPGRLMLAEHQQFHLQDHGLITLASRIQTPILMADVQASEDYVVSDMLPETKSELVLPMLIGNSLIGVLDLQSDEVNHFSEDDQPVLRTLAEQIAIAIRNAELYTDTQQAQKQAEEASQVKSQFLASVSHELRTPLNAILNFTQFVSNGMVGPVNEEQVDVLGKVVDSGKHLLSLINDVLDISKVESGDLKLFVEDGIDIRKEVESIADTSQILLQDKDVELVTNLPDDLPLMVGDKRRMRQIMLNLVSNACKFTDKGTVTIDLQCENDHVIVAIRDTGPGIPIEDYDIIFESFRQSRTGLQHGEGTGLGLAISKRLAEAHEGSLWLDSIVGKGSNFYVKLPVESPTLKAMIRRKVKAQ